MVGMCMGGQVAWTIQCGFLATSMLHLFTSDDKFSEAHTDPEGELDGTFCSQERSDEECTRMHLGILFCFHDQSWANLGEKRNFWLS